MPSRIVAEPDEWTRSSVTLPKRLWSRLETNLKAVNSNRPAPEKLTRDQFLASCIKFALDEAEAEARLFSVSDDSKMRRAAR
jgi:hypothetical protein